MGTYKGIQIVAICIVMPLILANAQHGEWSTWSECFDIGSYHDNDVVATSHRSRSSCRESLESKPSNTTDCKELHFEIRTCQKCQNCSQGSTPNTNKQKMSLSVNTDELEEYYRMAAEGHDHRPHQATHSRQLRAADLFSFLSGSPSNRGKSRSSQTNKNSKDFLRLLNLAGTKKKGKNEDKHLNSLWDVVEKIPKHETKKDGLEKHVGNLNDLLQIAGPTSAKEEQTSQQTTVSPKLTTLQPTGIVTPKTTLTETPSTQLGKEATSQSNIGYEVQTSYQPVEATEKITTTEVRKTSTLTSSTLTPTHEMEEVTYYHPTSLETKAITFGEKRPSFLITTSGEHFEWSASEMVPADTTISHNEFTTSAVTEEVATQSLEPERTPLTSEVYYQQTTLESIPAETTISLGEFTTSAVTEEVTTQERELTSTTITTSREHFPIEVQSTPRLEARNEVIPDPDDFLKLLDDTVKESVDKDEKVNPKDLEDLGNLINEAEETVDNNQLSEHLDALNKLVKLGEPTTLLPTTTKSLTERLTTGEVSTVSLEPERTPLTSEVYYEQTTSENIPAETTVSLGEFTTSAVTEEVATQSLRPEKTPLTSEVYYQQTTLENIPAETTISLGEFTTSAVTEEVTTQERELTSTTITTSREHFPVEVQSTPRLEARNEVIPDPDDFLKLLDDTVKESVDKDEKVNPKDLEDLGNLINEAEETVDNNQLSEHLDALNKLVKLGEPTTLLPTTEESLTERLTTGEVSTVSLEPERTPLTSEVYYEQTTSENIPAETTISLGEFTTSAVTEEVTTEESELTSTTITTSREYFPVETLSTSRVETQNEVSTAPDDFLKLLGDTIKESVDKHEKVDPKDLEDLGNLINEVKETVDNNQLSEHLDALNELVKLGETTSLHPTTEEMTTEEHEQELELMSTTLMPESQPVLAHTTPIKLQTTAEVIRQTIEPTHPEEPPAQVKETTPIVQQDFLELLDETLRDVGRNHHTPDPKDLQDIQDLIEVAEKTMDNEQLSKNLNQLSQILNPVELPVTTEKTTRTFEATPAAIFGEDLLNLIDKAGMGKKAEIPDAYLDKMLDEIGNLSESKVSGKELDLIKELLKLGGEEHTTSLQLTEASTAKPVPLGGQYLLEFLNKTELINPEDIQDEFRDELNILNQFLSDNNLKPAENVKEIIDKIGGILRRTTPATTTTETATSLYSTTLPALSTTKVGAPLLGLMEQLEETEKKHREENHRQVQNLQDLFQDVGEADKDIFSHELNHLNQFLNPSTISIETTKFVPRPTTVPSTTVTRDKVLDFVGEVAELQEVESQRSKEDIDNINQIFESLQESDGEFLDNEVHQLFGLLAPGEVTPTRPLTTEVYRSTAKLKGEELIDFIDDFEKTKAKTGEENMVQIQNFEKLFKEVKEPNQDILSHEIGHLNQLLNPSTVSMETSEPTSKPPLGILTITPSSNIFNKNVLDFVDKLVKLALNDTLNTRAEVDNLEELFKGLNESDEAVLNHEVHQLLGLLVPISTTKAAPPTTTLSGQYLLELFNKTELINREKILDELGKDINLVDSILEKGPLHSNEELLDHIGNLIEEKSTAGTPFPVTTEALASEATAKTKEQHLLNLIETLGKTKPKISEDNLIEVQALEEIFKTSMDEDKDKLMEDLARLKAILRPEHTTKQPLTSEVLVTLPTTIAPGVGLLDLINGINETEKEKLEGELGMQDIHDVLVEVHEIDEEDMLAEEVKHLSELFLPAGVSPSQPSVVPTTVSKMSTLQPTIEGKYLLDLLLQVEKDNGSKLIEDLRNDENLVNQFVETGKIKFGNDLQEAIGQIGMLLNKKTTEAPVFLTTELLQQPSVAITVKTPSTSTETDNKLILDLIDTLGKEKLQELQGVQDIQDVLVDVHEPDEEDMLAAEVAHFSELFLPAGVSTLQPTTTASEISILQPTIEGKYILDLLLQVEKGNGSKLIEDLRNDENVVNQFVETGKRKFGDDLQEAIGQIGMLLSKKTTEVPVFLATELLKQPSVTITAKTPSTSTETDNKLILELIDTLGKEKFQEIQGAKDIQDVLGEVQEADAEVLLAEEVKHIADILLPTRTYNPQTTAVPSTFAKTVSENKPSTTRSTTSASYPTIGGKYILDFLQQVEKVDWNELIDDFNHDKAMLNQFVETGTVRFGDDLKQAIGQIGVLLSKEITSEVPVVTERESTTPSAKATSENPFGFSPELMQTTRPASELFLDLIDTLGKIKAEDGKENRLEIQKLQTIFDKEKIPTDEILNMELDRLKQLWSPVEYPTEVASVSPWLETTMASSTIAAGENLLNIFDEVAEVAKEEQEVDKEDLGIINDILKGAVNESDRLFLNDEVNHLLDLLLPEEVSTSTLSPTEEVTTHLEGFGVTSVTQQSKKYQEALLDLLSGHAVFENKLREDTDVVQNIAELFANLKQTDKDLLVNEIAQLDYDLQYGEPTTPAVSILISSQQMIPSITQQIIVASKMPSSPKTEATYVLPPEPSSKAGGETFLDNLRYLVGQINTDLPWDDMERVGALSEELDKDAEQKVEEELGFVKDIMHDVGEMEKSTPETVHVMTTTLMQNVTATTHVSPTTKMMTSAFTPTPVVLAKETTVAAGTTPGIPRETTERLETTRELSNEVTEGLEATRKISSPTPTTLYSPVDRWTEWSSWGDCSTTCGLGKQSRRRECRLFIEGLAILSTNCKGSRTETMVCEIGQCPAPIPTTLYSPVDRWTEWSSWGDCSSTCGLGKQSRRRECRLFIEGLAILSTNCKGSRTETMVCEMRQCPAPIPTTLSSPVDRWTEWSSWGDCSTTCGLGKQSRRRECRLFSEGLAIPSTNCEGNRTETIDCEMRQCPAPIPTTLSSPVDRWTDWSSWGDCSSTCDLGEQSRRRECRLFIQGIVIPSTNCEGSRAETMVCKLRRCPAIPRVDGQWSEWSAWTDCSSMCGPGNRTHYRLCDNPGPSGDGLPCEGAMTESQECFGDAKLCKQAGAEGPVLIRTTPKPHIVRPPRKPVNKTVAVAVLATFIVVVVVVLVACIVFRVRKSYGSKQYRGDRPMFYR